ncbi:MAG: hypothetical protein KBS70_03495 [Bacteroidales bacterium]|nr:hypothetical protein [Candidatus Colicola equi]
MNSLIKKERFDKVYSLISASAAAGKVHPEESYLRMSLPILGGKSAYTFNPKAESSYPADRALDRNDVFVINQMGLFVTLRNNTNPQVEKHFTFVPVNDGTHPSIYPEGFTTEALNALYNGSIQWLQDNQVMMSDYPVLKFKYIPETQGAFVLNSTDQAVAEYVQPQFSLDKACALQIPRITVAGTRDTKINLAFDASGLAFPTTEGWTPYLTLLIDGFLIKGGCEYFDGNNAFGAVVGQW